MAGFLFKSPSYQLVDANGDVYPGAKINFYLTGTSTRSDIYQDSGLATPHTNPVVADSAGLFAPIYLDPTITYKVVVTDTDDVVLQTIDPVVIDIGTGNTPFKDLTPAADKLPYYTSSTAAALADFTDFGRTLIERVNEAAFKTLVNLRIGTDVQAYHAYLADIAGLSPSNGDLLEFDGSDFVTRSSYNLGFNHVECFTASGTWTAPADTNIMVWAFGGGGSGGSRSSSTGTGGGGAGGSCMKRMAVSSGLVLTITVGAGGAAPIANSAGNAGGNTTVTGTGISLTANGGAAGAVTTTGGAGGTATGGDINWTGGDGGDGASQSGGGGGACGIIRDGIDGANGTTNTGGAGGGLHASSYTLAGFAGCNHPPLVVSNAIGGAGGNTTSGSDGGNFCGSGGSGGTGSGATLYSGYPGVGAGSGGASNANIAGRSRPGGTGMVLVAWNNNS